MFSANLYPCSLTKTDVVILAIYILNSRPEDSLLIDEILGLEPIFLHGDLTKLTLPD